jgi:hypothetical protein
MNKFIQLFIILLSSSVGSIFAQIFQKQCSPKRLLSNDKFR